MKEKNTHVDSRMDKLMKSRAKKIRNRWIVVAQLLVIVIMIYISYTFMK